MKKMIVSALALAVVVFVAVIGSAQQAPPVPFAERHVKFENGVIGRPLSFESANPRNFEEIIGEAVLRPVKLDGQLFVPAGAGPYGVVILVPGSRGVIADYLKHAQELTSVGLAVYALDPLAGRGIKDIVSDKTGLSMAASAYDVLAAARMLVTQPSIDRQRIGAMGYSRGGAAVLLASYHQMTSAVLGDKVSLKAVLAAWPTCDYQFAHAITAPKVVRFLVGDSDNWTSPAQCQGQASAMQANNPEVSIRLFKGAYHAFGHYEPVAEMPNAMKFYTVPTTYINDQGAFLDIYSGKTILGADDAHMRGPWGVRGTVTVGTKPGQTEAFVDDMVSFFKAQLRP